jgi:hypothetical protein
VGGEKQDEEEDGREKKGRACSDSELKTQRNDSVSQNSGEGSDATWDKSPDYADFCWCFCRSLHMERETEREDRIKFTLFIFVVFLNLLVIKEKNKNHPILNNRKWIYM